MTASQLNGHQIPYTYFGKIKTEEEAIEIIEKSHYGVYKRVMKRLTDDEKQNIQAGHVFVFIKDKINGMVRWTDGKNWTPSKVVTPFLIYHELLRRYAHYNRLSTELHPDDIDDLRNLREECLNNINNNIGEMETKQKGTFIYKKYGLIKKTYTYHLNGHEYRLIAYESNEEN